MIDWLIKELMREECTQVWVVILCMITAYINGIFTFHSFKLVHKSKER